MSPFLKYLALFCFVLITTLSCSTHKNTTIVQKKSAIEFNQKLANTSESSRQLIDIRTPTEYSTGYINNAINIDFYNPNFEIEINKLDKTKPIYVYCKAGGRSSDAVNIFIKNGFKEIYDLKGGMMGWEQAGLPIMGIQEATSKQSINITTSNIFDKRESLSVEEFQKIAAASSVTIVDFNAVWCGPCRRLAPILDDLEKRYGNKIKIIKIDVDKNKILANHFVISSIPFLQFYKNGRVQEQIEGLPSKENLIYQIEKLLK